MRSLKYLLGWLIAGTRGGPTRAKIISALQETPQNANQLATLLKMDRKKTHTFTMASACPKHVRTLDLAIVHPLC